MKEEIVDGVKITTDDNGNLHFEVIDDKKDQKQECKPDTRSWFAKMKDWWTNAKVRPYVKVRDLADPFGDRDDIDAGSDGVKGVEAGIQIRF